MVYVIVGPPVALARHRFSANGSIYDSQKTLKRSLAISLSNQHDDRPMYHGPLELVVTFIFPHKGVNKKKKPYWHTQRPDSDNLLKLVCDVGNGILWEDDKTICKITLLKIHGPEERTEFRVIELDPDAYPREVKEKVTNPCWNCESWGLKECSDDCIKEKEEYGD